MDMLRPLWILLVALLACSACRSTEPFYSYEAEDLIVVQHNDYNKYLLLVYRDPLGQTKHVLRRNGVTEMVLTYTIDGRIKFKARGQKERIIGAVEAGRLTHRINSLLNAREDGAGIVTST